MTPALRAATVVTAFTLSYGMIAATPAAADVVAAGTTAEVGPTSTVAPQALATTLRAKPYDVNGDGYSDAVVGAPGEGIGTTSQAGMLHVLYGRSTGITASGDRIIHQGTAGVPGSPEEGDWFGWTNASGDFNADGYADIAVSARAESVAAADVAGLVQVFYGSPTGPQTGNVTTLEVPREGLELGSALAAGDFNGDGKDDLAVGGPWNDSGSVFVYTGTSGGLSTAYQEFTQGVDEVPGTPVRVDGFGDSLSAGDINGDGHSDLAIGVRNDTDDSELAGGAVTLLYGSASGLNANHDGQRFSKETPGVPGSSGSVGENESSDSFGYDVVLADFNGDGKADLAVGAPGSPVTYDGLRKPDAGTVTILYSDGTHIGTDNAAEITQATAGIPGIPGRYDRLGETLAVGDANGDRRYELAAFSIGDGYVTAIPGSTAGLVTTSAKGWTQNSSGIPGVSEAEDTWGWSLRFQDIKNTGYQSLVVGAEGENNFRGAFTVIHSTSTGLIGTGAQIFHQDTYGVLGTAEPYDRLGAF